MSAAEPTPRRYRRRTWDVEAFCYEGVFPLSFLRYGEKVRSATVDSDGTIEIETPQQVITVSVGEWIARDDDGELTAYPHNHFLVAFKPAGGAT